jgi:hypothetical protein
MRGIVGRFGVGAVAGLVVLAAAARAAEEKIPPDKLPKEVRAAVDGKFPGAELTSIEKETENGQVVYDIELKHKGRKYEMDIKEDGTILEIEKEIAAKDLPEAVTKALEAKYPKATYEEVMEKVKGKETKPSEYEVVLVTADKKKLEVTLTPDGKIVEESKGEGDKK